MRKVLSASLIILGAVGLCVSFFGEFTELGDYESASPRRWEQFDPQLVKETPDLASLQRKIDLLTNQAITEQEEMLVIYNVVINRFTHSDQAKYNIFSNWLLWLMGGVNSNFSHIRQPAVVLEKGYSALCGEQAYLLQTLAESNGIRTRAVGLNGHVVMEAWYDNNWHLYDPDLEAIPLLESQLILSLDELAKSPELINKYYAGKGSEEYTKRIVNIIASREDNSFSSYPRLVLFEWKSNVLFHIEKIANWGKWVIPIILLVVNLGFFKSKK